VSKLFSFENAAKIDIILIPQKLFGKNYFLYLCRVEAIERRRKARPEAEMPEYHSR
jgi:hypothetical protein